jgi:hypothetical protein
MKQRLLIIAIFLLFGAVANVVVAWGSALRITKFGWYDDPSWVGGVWPETDPVFDVQLQTCFGYASLLTLSFFDSGDDPYKGLAATDTWLPSWARCRAAEDSSDSWEDERDLWDVWVDRCVLIETAAGWPFLSLHSSFCCRGGANPSNLTWEVRHVRGALIPDWLSDSGYPEMLPLRPIWRGFAVNTIFYAAILWLLIGGPFVLRRFIRRRRGLCPACAYPMGQLPVCTECGRALSQSARAASSGPT